MNLNENNNNNMIKKNIKYKLKEKNKIINSPEFIQNIIKSNSINNNLELKRENDIVTSLLSFNNTALKILDIDNLKNFNNFNPLVELNKQRNKIYKLNFKNNHFNQKNLDYKVKQYIEINQKIVKNNSLNNNEYNIIEELFIINHPLISLFKDYINLTKLKNNIYNKYIIKMKDNTKFQEEESFINEIEENGNSSNTSFNYEESIISIDSNVENENFNINNNENISENYNFNDSIIDEELYENFYEI